MIVPRGIKASISRRERSDDTSPNNVFFYRFDDVAIDGVLGDSKGAQEVVLIDMGLGILDGQSATAADDQRALGRMMLSFVSDLSPAQKQVLERSQDVRPEGRFPSLVELWKAFDGAKRGGDKGKSAHTSATATTVVPTIRVAKRTPGGIDAGSRRTYMILGGVVFASLTLSGFLLLRKSDKPAPTVVKPAPAAGPESKAVEVSLRFQVSPASARPAIKVDGQPVEGETLKLPRRETAITVSAEAEGYAPFESKVIPYEDRTVEISLTPASTESAGDDGDKKAKKAAKKKKAKK